MFPVGILRAIVLEIKIVLYALCMSGKAVVPMCCLSSCIVELLKGSVFNRSNRIAPFTIPEDSMSL